MTRTSLAPLHMSLAPLLMSLAPVHPYSCSCAHTLTPGARYVKLFAGGGLGDQVGIHVAGVYARRDGQSAYT